jgi:hypothetical protein
MLKSRLSFLAIGLVIGAMVGLNAGGFWPQIPVHAVAVQGADNFILATGPLDEEVEAVIFLDGLTGDLKAAAVGLINGKFNAFFQHNINKDFGNVKSPKYLMTTGMVNLRRGAGAGNVSPSNSAVYIAEVTSGQVAAYGIPWNNSLRVNNQPQNGNFYPLDIIKMRNVAVRQAAGG